MSQIWRRLRTRVEEITRPWRWAVHGWLVRCGPRIYLLARWPWPLRRPYERPALTILPPGGGIGDELMCTTVFAAIRVRNPRCHITFVSRHPDLFRQHELIDAVVPKGQPYPGPAYKLAYHYALPPPRPLVSLLAEGVGIAAEGGIGSLPPLAPSPEVQARLQALPRPLVVIQPLDSGWTKNKAWPRDSWHELVQALVHECTVVEIGTATAFPGETFGPRFYSFAGQTSVAEFIAIIAQATLFVGPSSAGMHIAAACGVRSLIIFGGYERAAGYDFPLLEALESDYPCAPCWRLDCPFGLKCMDQITPGRVLARIRQALLSSPPHPIA